MITQSEIFLSNSFTKKYKTKIKLDRDKKPSTREIYIRLSISYSKYCLHVEIIPASMAARQVQDYYNIKLYMYEGPTALRHNTVISGSSAS